MWTSSSSIEYFNLSFDIDAQNLKMPETKEKFRSNFIIKSILMKKSLIQVKTC